MPKTDHRIMRVEMTPKMREIAEQRHALHAFLQGMRQRAETRCLDGMSGR